MAVENNGTTNFFEASHPLNSGDPNDFSLSAGDTIGFCLIYFKDGMAITDSTYPTSCNLVMNEQLLYVLGP